MRAVRTTKRSRINPSDAKRRTLSKSRRTKPSGQIHVSVSLSNARYLFEFAKQETCFLRRSPNKKDQLRAQELCELVPLLRRAIGKAGV